MPQPADDTRFPARFLEPWCRIWRHVDRHRQWMAGWLGQRSPADAAVAMAIPAEALDAALGDVLEKLDAGKHDSPLLARALGCLHALERLHPCDPRVFVHHPPVFTAGQNHALLPPLRRTTRSTDPAALFPLATDLAVDGTLKLGYRWLPLQAADKLVWRHVALDALRGVSPLRIGLAPFAAADAMDWKADAQDVRAPDHRVPVRCHGALTPEQLWASVETLLAAASAQNIHLLLMPELVVDEGLLQRCRDWLRRNNPRHRHPRLVVAGSRHCADGGEFANRCTVLDFIGNILWEQDKRSPFVIDDADELRRLCPEDTPAKVFEPTALGRTLVVAESVIGRLLTPICLDYIEGDLWRDLGADIYLVPAMTKTLGRFALCAEDLGGRHGAATFVCNAQTGGNQRCLAYLPVKGGTKVAVAPVEGHALFIVEVPLYGEPT